MGVVVLAIDVNINNAVPGFSTEMTAPIKPPAFVRHHPKYLGVRQGFVPRPPALLI